MKPIDLKPHPEGGKFKEVFRSRNIITREDGATRNALTHIYFALEHGEVSKFHKVEADEVWNLYSGEGLYLYLWDGTNKKPARYELSPETNCYCYVVPAGTWQAAEPKGQSVLVGCSVGPGFEFEDFELIHSHDKASDLMNALSPSFSKFI